MCVCRLYVRTYIRRICLTRPVALCQRKLGVIDHSLERNRRRLCISVPVVSKVHLCTPLHISKRSNARRIFWEFFGFPHTFLFLDSLWFQLSAGYWNHLGYLFLINLFQNSKFSRSELPNFGDHCTIKNTFSTIFYFHEKYYWIWRKI